MSSRENIDRILAQWDYNPGEVNVRKVRGDDRRPLLQMRIDMGIMQLETKGRPDGTRPHGFETYYDYLLSRMLADGEFVLDDDQCDEVDREFVQYYHRRICWLTLRDFAKAVNDADHTLSLMDLCVEVSPDEEWTISHEQYRPFVLFHRTQAAAMAALDEIAPEPETAVHQLNVGLDRMHDLFVEHDAEDMFEDDDLVTRLTELRDSVRDHYNIGRTLQEQLDDAIAEEKYELAARLRDQLARKGHAGR